MLIGSESVYIPAGIDQAAILRYRRLQISAHFRRSPHVVFEVSDLGNLAQRVADFVNPSLVAVSEADDSSVFNNSIPVGSRIPKESCVVECLNQLPKSVRRHDVMLLARDCAAAKALIVDMATTAEIDVKSRTTQPESVALRVRENDVVERRRRQLPRLSDGRIPEASDEAYT